MYILAYSENKCCILAQGFAQIFEILEQAFNYLYFNIECYIMEINCAIKTSNKGLESK